MKGSDNEMRSVTDIQIIQSVFVKKKLLRKQNDLGIEFRNQKIEGTKF